MALHLHLVLFSELDVLPSESAPQIYDTHTVLTHTHMIKVILAKAPFPSD